MPPIYIYIITMAYSNFSNTTSKFSPAKIYGDAGLIYIIYHAQIETKPSGQKKIGGSRPAFSKITKTTHLLIIGGRLL